MPSENGLTRREELLAVATKLFAARGYHGTRMDDVADVIGLNKATVYHYYASKSLILFDIYRQAAAGMNRLGLWHIGAGVSILGRFSLLVTQDRVAEIVGELASLCSIPRAAAVLSELYALALAATGRAAEAREWAERILRKKATMPDYIRRRERPWFRKTAALLKRVR